MQQGFNHNIRVEDVLFHVQTEDKTHPKFCIETIVLHSGAIVYCKRKLYNPNEMSGEQIKLNMQKQHKKVLKEVSKKQLKKVVLFLEKRKSLEETEQ